MGPPNTWTTTCPGARSLRTDTQQSRARTQLHMMMSVHRFSGRGGCPLTKPGRSVLTERSCCAFLNFTLAWEGTDALLQVDPPPALGQGVQDALLAGVPAAVPAPEAAESPSGMSDSEAGTRQSLSCRGRCGRLRIMLCRAPRAVLGIGLAMSPRAWPRSRSPARRSLWSSRPSPCSRSSAGGAPPGLRLASPALGVPWSSSSPNAPNVVAAPREHSGTDAQSPVGPPFQPPAAGWDRRVRHRGQHRTKFHDETTTVSTSTGQPSVHTEAGEGATHPEAGEGAPSTPSSTQ